MRFFDNGGDLALVLGQENDETPRVSIVRGEVPVVEMAAIDDGGYVCARSQDFEGPLVEINATSLGALVNVGDGGRVPGPGAMRRMLLRLAHWFREMVAGLNSAGSTPAIGGGPAPGGVNRLLKSTYVAGHRTRSGRYVRPHYRRPPRH